MKAKDNQNLLHGFTLVEMLVALFFTGVLMVGLSTVFKSSLSSMIKTNETVSGDRRNNMSLDMIYDDLGHAGMLLSDITVYPNNIISTDPAFYVVPNVNFGKAGFDPQTDLPASWIYPPSTSDELYLYCDDPVPFDGTIMEPAVAMVPGKDSRIQATETFEFEFEETSHASMIKKGMCFTFRDSYGAKYINQDPVVNGNKVKVVVDGPMKYGAFDDEAGNAKGWEFNAAHFGGRKVLFVNPAQRVRYSIQCRQLDPGDPLKEIPCLVREQGPYGGKYDASLTSVIAENVIGFKVFVSVDNGVTWAGLGEKGVTAKSADAGPWNNVAGSYKKVLDSALAKVGREGHKSIDDPVWFREIPAVVRIDLLTRTAIKRAEYGNGNPEKPTAEYGTQLKTMMIIPRHFGLSLK